MDKIILINKEKGYTSRDVVNLVGKKFKTRKVGHFGTLDPLATGLLVVGIGACTKIGNFLENDSKEYKVEVLIGVSTDTYDITGNILKEENVFIDENKIVEKLLGMTGKQLQEVPIYSAVKVNGKKLYEYARKGEEVVLPKKEINIFEIKDICFFERDGRNYFSFVCHVSKGTYIRSIINDLSKKINVPLCMSGLVRTKQDKFSLCDACSLEDLECDNYKLFDVCDVLGAERREIPSMYEGLILNGGLIPKIFDKMVLFTKDNEDIVLYGVYGDNMKPYLTFKK